MTFRNKLIFDGEEFLAPRPTPKVEEHQFSTVSDVKIIIHNTAILPSVLCGCTTWSFTLRECLKTGE
jgi:hypothetical protein